MGFSGVACSTVLSTLYGPARQMQPEGQQTFSCQAKFSFIIILLFDVNILIGIFLLIEIIILFSFLYTFNRISSIIHTLDFIHYVVTCTMIKIGMIEIFLIIMKFYTVVVAPEGA